MSEMRVNGSSSPATSAAQEGLQQAAIAAITPTVLGEIVVGTGAGAVKGVDLDPKAKSFAAQEGISGGSLTGGAVTASLNGDTSQLEADGTLTANAEERNIVDIPSAAEKTALKMSVASLTDAATVTPDFSQSNNFRLDLLTATGASRTLANPLNPTVGQSGVIYLIQDGDGQPRCHFRHKLPIFRQGCHGAHNHSKCN